MEVKNSGDIEGLETAVDDEVNMEAGDDEVNMAEVVHEAGELKRLREDFSHSDIY